jgi:hypothetical protein
MNGSSLSATSNASDAGSAFRRRLARPAMDEANMIAPDAQYASWLSAVAGQPADTIARMFGDHFAEVWIERYHEMCKGPTNVLEVPLKLFTYLFDFCSELIDAGELAVGAREDRALGAYGISQSAKTARDSSRIRGFPGSDERGDRGHLAAHSAGGGLDINIFHQDAYFNRGWSPAGKRYREMERYCAQNTGTFFFTRLIYRDESARPAQIEFGILRTDHTLWFDVFENAGAA